MTRRILKHSLKLMLAICMFASLATVWGGDDLTDFATDPGGQYTGFSNLNSIVNTRHNLTQSTLGPNPGSETGLTFGGVVQMWNYRNDYGEVCVYCHTPHGASTNVAAPLWNRNIKATTYTTYDRLGTSTLTQTVYQPGAGSLPCLSCHDGQQAVDAIINMPGSGRYNPNPSGTTGINGDLWTRWAGGGGSRAFSHAGLSAVDPNNPYGSPSCLVCHAPSGISYTAVDFSLAAIGTDLRDDHPVGVKFPEGTNDGWNPPNGTKMVGSLRNTFFDENSNGRMDKGEIRLYDTGNGPSVECASCHDPHGVPGVGGKMNRTFLRKANAQSAVCMTCHAR